MISGARNGQSSPAAFACPETRNPTPSGCRQTVEAAPQIDNVFQMWWKSSMCKRCSGKQLNSLRVLVSMLSGEDWSLILKSWRKRQFGGDGNQFLFFSFLGGVQIMDSLYKSVVVACELVHQLEQGQKELCVEEKWERPFLFASWIYGYGNRSCVANVHREGTHWAMPMMDGWTACSGWTSGQPSGIRLPLDSWPLAASPAPHQETCASLTPLLILPFLIH